MKTRRKSKAAAAAAAEAENTDAEAAHSEAEGGGPSQIVDLSGELAATQREVEELRAEVEKRDIELEQAYQDKESSARELEIQLEETRVELEKVRLEREELRASRNTLQTQVSTLNSSHTVSSSELDVLKNRVEDTEREKRDLLGIVSRLKDDGAQRDEEVQSLRGKLKEVRTEYQTLETQLRELRSTESSTKFKLESLSQQLQLAQGDAERNSTELAAKSEEFAKYRHSKHAELTRLQSSHDALLQTHASSEGQLKALQTSYKSQEHQLSQALSRVQDLTGRLAEQEATYTSETAGLKRLVQMMEDREAQAKKIVDTIEAEWASVGAKAEKREAVLRDELDREKQRVEDAENRIEEMERILQKVNRGELPLPGAIGSVPSTPARGETPDLMTQGMMGLSPTVAMASRAQKTGKTFTEVYADYVRLEDEHAKLLQEYERMDRTLGQVLAQIEERAPVLAQQRAEYERLQSEANQLASQLADALVDRDAQAGLAKDAAQKLSKTSRENELLQKQLGDLGRQVQALTRQLARLQDPTIPSDEDMEVDDTTLPAENIDQVITNNLVLFRSIGGLQEQNQKLLGIVRELGAKMEAEERDYRDALEKEQSEAVREAHDAIQELQSQLESQRKTSDIKIQAYIKERDSLRLLLSRAEHAAGRPLELNGHASTAPASDSELAKELTEIQEQFAAYRTEMGLDSERLRDDYVASQREVAQLTAMLAKANAKVEVMNERHKSSQEQFKRQSRDVDDLQKRNQQLYDQYTRVDIECNRVTEDLIASNGRLEQLRNECANLRAEKHIWESVQGRLVEENKALSMERSHLSDLMSNVQKMHNDLERSGENDRRRLENQIQVLENQSQDLRSQLTQERDSIRHASLQKEVEIKELRASADRNTSELTKTREKLIEADTSRKHLEDRVADLSRQLQGNEEKLSVYERRGSTVAGAHQHPSGDATREQQLETQVAELSSALKVAEVDLATARSHIQQFQEISQASEAALSTLNATYDQYKASSEAQIMNSQAERDRLQEQLQSAEQTLVAAQEGLAESKRALEAERKEWLSDKKTLEDTIFGFTSSEKAFAEDRTSRESDVRAQEDRVKAAEDKYSREVVAHAEDIKAIEALKKRLSELQVSARDNITAAETAQAKLASSEASWSQQRQALDREITDLTARCTALTEQNNVLHQHLDTVSSQAARIREAADSSATANGDESIEDPDAKLSELRSVITYLRKEKEIVDMQLELSKQESARLKAQIGHLTHDLEDTRATLSEERERAVSTAATDAQHSELVDKIQQLNLLRESNATLRADSEAHAKRARELDARSKILTREIEPLREQVRTLQADLDAQKGHVSKLEDENRRWQERNAQLLSKYDRIDPAEVQALKNEIERLTAEKAAWETSSTSHDEKLKAEQAESTKMRAALQASREQYQRGMQGFKTRLGEVNNQKLQATEALKEAENQLKAVTAERDSLQASAASATPALPPKDLTDELQKLRDEVTRLEQALQEEKARVVPSSVPDLDVRLAQLTEERDKLLAEKASWTSPSMNGADQTSSTAWEAEKAELLKNRDEVTAEAQAAREEANKLKEEARGLKLANDKYSARIQEQARARQRAVEEQEATVKLAVEKATQELQAAASTSAPNEELLKKHTEELTALEARLRAEYDAALKTATEAAAANAPSATEDSKTAIAAAVAAKETELRAEQETLIAKAIESGRQEVQVKMKVKDAQLVRAQGRLKQLEAQLEEMKKAGLIPAADGSATSPQAAVPPAASSSSAHAPEATATATASTSTAPAARGGAPGGLPRRPTAGNVAGAAPERGRGRGRGVARGLTIRGTAPGSAGRGGGVSIAGAAAKRAREEGETGGEGALAKRLKSAEPAASASSGEGSVVAAAPAVPASAPGTSKPVTLQRNRVGPS